MQEATIDNVFTVVNTEIRVDSEEKRYKVLRIANQGKKMIANMEVNAPVKVSSLVAYEEPKYEDTPQFGWDLNKGDNIVGSRLTIATEPYDIIDKSTGEVTNTAQSYTMFLPGVISPTDVDILKGARRGKVTPKGMEHEDEGNKDLPFDMPKGEDMAEKELTS